MNTIAKLWRFYVICLCIGALTSLIGFPIYTEEGGVSGKAAAIILLANLIAAILYSRPYDKEN